MKPFKMIPIAILILIAGCAVTRPGSIDVSQRPLIGMSTTEVRGMWGNPTRTSFDVIDGTLYQTYLYQRKQRVYLPYGRRTHYDRVDYYAVRFVDGKVTGISQ